MNYTITLSITSVSIVTQNIMGLIATLSITIFSTFHVLHSMVGS